MNIKLRIIQIKMKQFNLFVHIHRIQLISIQLN